VGLAWIVILALVRITSRPARHASWPVRLRTAPIAREGGYPAVGRSLPTRPGKMLPLTTPGRRRLSVAAVKAGAAGYLAKTAPGDGYLRAIRRGHRGEIALPINLARQVLRHEELPAAKDLTRREMEILRLVAEGLSNQQIAARIGVGTATVVTHVRNVFAKLGVGNRVEATLYALEQGWTSLERTATARGWRKRSSRASDGTPGRKSRVPADSAPSPA
jgi:DNA-binding CsgD family transcriptional regulator